MQIKDHKFANVSCRFDVHPRSLTCNFLLFLSIISSRYYNIDMLLQISWLSRKSVFQLQRCFAMWNRNEIVIIEKHFNKLCSWWMMTWQRSAARLPSRTTVRSRSWRWAILPQRRARQSQLWAALSHRVSRTFVSPCWRKVKPLLFGKSLMTTTAFWFTELLDRSSSSQHTLSDIESLNSKELIEIQKNVDYSNYLSFCNS